MWWVLRMITMRIMIAQRFPLRVSAARENGPSGAHSEHNPFPKRKKKHSSGPTLGAETIVYDNWELPMRVALPGGYETEKIPP